MQKKKNECQRKREVPIVEYLVKITTLNSFLFLWDMQCLFEMNRK